MPHIYYKNTILEGFGTSCTFDYNNKETKFRIFTLFMLMGGFVLPMFSICFFYVLILCELKRAKNNFKNTITIQYNMKANYKSRSMTLVSEISEWEISNKGSSFKLDNKSACKTHLLVKRELKAFKNILLILFAFCVAWSPYAVLCIYAQFGDNGQKYVNTYTTTLTAYFAKMSSIFNPFIYTLSSSDFKRKFLNN